jgi:hypothetical protein
MGEQYRFPWHGFPGFCSLLLMRGIAAVKNTDLYVAGNIKMQIFTHTLS